MVEYGQQLLLTIYAVIIFLLELRQGGEDEAERGDHHEHAGHHRHHLEQGSVTQAGNDPSPWQRRSRGDSQTGSRGASAPPSSSGPQTPHPDHHPKTGNYM